MKTSCKESNNFGRCGRHIFSILLVAVIAAIYPNSGYCVKVGDLYFSTNESSKSAKVTYQTFQNYSNYEGLTSVHIPSSITVNGEKYKVTAIDDYAFYRAKDLSFISMDVGISEIGKFAFNECSSLISIIFPEKLEKINDMIDAR